MIWVEVKGKYQQEEVQIGDDVEAEMLSPNTGNMYYFEFRVLGLVLCKDGKIMVRCKPAKNQGIYEDWIDFEPEKLRKA